MSTKMKRITREEKRKLKNETGSILERLGIVINHAFPGWNNLIRLTISDPRDMAYVVYSLNSILMTQVISFCCGNKSMNSMNESFNSEATIQNMNALLETKYKELPHKDTIMYTLTKLEPLEIEKLNIKFIRQLIRSKVLDQFKHFGLWHIVIDGTELYSTLKDLGPGAITKTYNKGKENEYTVYSYYVLEAKLVCGNHAFSVCSEFVENAVKTDKNGNTYREFDKQDCETNAAYRLLKKLHKYFPKLGIIISGDALYINQNIFDLCKKFHFEYIMRYKETAASTIQKNFDEIKVEEDGYYYANDVIFGELKNKKFNTVNVITHSEEDKKTGETTEFKYVTSLQITSKNKQEIFEIGRARWKIENKGFNEQKTGILDIEHIYTKNSNATKCIYYLIQIASTFLTLLNCADCLIKALNVTKQEVSRLLMIDLTSQIHENLDFNKSIQLRFSSS